MRSTPVRLPGVRRGKTVVEDFEAIVIGAGEAGAIIASQAVQAGKKVAMIYREPYGSTCVNAGCVPMARADSIPQVVTPPSRSMPSKACPQHAIQSGKLQTLTSVASYRCHYRSRDLRRELAG